MIVGLLLLGAFKCWCCLLCWYHCSISMYSKLYWVSIIHLHLIILNLTCFCTRWCVPSLFGMPLLKFSNHNLHIGHNEFSTDILEKWIIVYFQAYIWFHLVIKAHLSFYGYPFGPLDILHSKVAFEIFYVKFGSYSG